MTIEFCVLSVLRFVSRWSMPSRHMTPACGYLSSMALTMDNTRASSSGGNCTWVPIRTHSLKSSAFRMSNRARIRSLTALAVSRSPTYMVNGCPWHCPAPPGLLESKCTTCTRVCPPGGFSGTTSARTGDWMPLTGSEDLKTRRISWLSTSTSWMSPCTSSRDLSCRVASLTTSVGSRRSLCDSPSWTLGLKKTTVRCFFDSYSVMGMLSSSNSSRSDTPPLLLEVASISFKFFTVEGKSCLPVDVNSRRCVEGYCSGCPAFLRCL
mmetsp:Transcript_40327/g.72067  ORF Transcript_40327/g.72067 Transcript_40327/m.72067 type:complete len:266 (+) Transcript_40327:294-1091(+)